MSGDLSIAFPVGMFACNLRVRRRGLYAAVGADGAHGDGVLARWKGCMTRKLLKTSAIVVVALAPVVAAGTAEAPGGGFSGGGFHVGGW